MLAVKQLCFDTHCSWTQVAACMQAQHWYRSQSVMTLFCYVDQVILPVLVQDGPAARQLLMVFDTDEDVINIGSQPSAFA